MRLTIRLSGCLLLAVIALSGCKKQIMETQRGEYRGGALHAQPSASVFPNENIYELSGLTDLALQNELDNNIENIIADAEINGISITMLIPNKGMWQSDSGYLQIGNSAPVDSTSVFYWASVTKLITSTIVHQLISEQKLEASDKLSNWYPQFENSTEITIGQLLNHTNGIYSFNSDSTLHFSNEYHSPSELLDVSLANSNLFPPGEYWSYTNTGYLLLALISESIEEKSYSEIVQERISEPLNLSSLHALEPTEQPINLALSHSQGAVVQANYSVPLGAGNTVSNSKDMALYMRALLTGEYLPVTTVHSMLEALYPMFDIGQYYGNGVMLIDFSEVNGLQKQWLGHLGGTENYKALLMYDVEKQVICAISVSQNIPVEAIANSMIGLIDE